MVVGEPLQEFGRFANVGGIGGRRRGSAQLGGKLERAVTHRLPIADDRTHVGDHRLDSGPERVENRSVTLTIDLGMNEQNTVQDRTQEQVHLVAVAREQLAHTVDDEREVVGDDQDDGVR